MRFESEARPERANGGPSPEGSCTSALNGAIERPAEFIAVCEVGRQQWRTAALAYQQLL